MSLRAALVRERGSSSSGESGRAVRGWQPWGMMSSPPSARARRCCWCLTWKRRFGFYKRYELKQTNCNKRTRCLPSQQSAVSRVVSNSIENRAWNVPCAVFACRLPVGTKWFIRTSRFKLSVLLCPCAVGMDFI